MKRLRSNALTLAASSWLALGSVAYAYPTGVTDQATPASGGCSCHSGVLDNPTTAVKVLILVDNVPIDQFSGYTPGQSYDVSIWVLGPILPFAGFNLKAGAGTLASADTTSQVLMRTECDLVKARTTPTCTPGGAPGNDCQVKKTCQYDPGAFAACSPCTAAEESQDLCRPCDGATLVDIQATHAEPPPLISDAKPVPNWDLTWIAPSPGVGDVVFYAAGNSVSGEGTSALDQWNFLEPNPVVVHQAPAVVGQ